MTSSLRLFCNRNYECIQIILAFLHFATAVGVLLVPTNNLIKFPLVRLVPPNNKAVTVLNMDLRNPISVIEVITGLAHIFYLTKKGRGETRMYEYLITSSIMIVVIGSLCGVEDIFTLTALLFLQMSTILFGLFQEKFANQLSFSYPFYSGLIPYLGEWFIIFYYFLESVNNNDADISDGMLGVFFSITFVLFSSFALNSYLWIRKNYDYEGYLYGCDILSLSSKLFLAWFILGGVLNN